MPHIDEGTLHALHDGALAAEDPGAARAARAHLAACADCRARLDEAAALSGRASGILGDAGAETRPDFEEVLVLAGRPPTGMAGEPEGRERLRRRLRGIRAVAWAATVVLALGTGYMARQLIGPPAAETVRLDTRPLGDADPMGAPHDEPDPAVVEPYDAPAHETVRRPVPPSDRRVEEAPETPGAAADARAEATPAPTPDPEPVGTPVAESDEMPAEPPRRGRVPDAEPESLVAGEAVVTGAAAPRAAALRAAAEPERPAVPPALARPLAVTEAGRPVGVTEAVDLGGGTLYVLPDALVVEASALGRGAGAAIRTVQRTGGGAVVVVLQRARPAVEAVADDAAAPAGSIVVPRGAHLLTLEGPLAPDSLRSLAEAAEPLRRR